MWFEVKGRFPSSAELLKAQKLARGTGLSVYVYFEELALPAPADLAEMTEEEFFDHEEEWLWSVVDIVERMGLGALPDRTRQMGDPVRPYRVRARPKRSGQ